MYTLYFVTTMELESESESCSAVSNSLQPHVLHSPWNSPGQNTGVGSLSLVQGIFPTQESKSGLPHGRQIFYQLSHQGSPRRLQWIAYPSAADLGTYLEIINNKLSRRTLNNISEKFMGQETNHKKIRK